MIVGLGRFYGFFFNDPATTEIYTLSLHDALPICLIEGLRDKGASYDDIAEILKQEGVQTRSEEHTSELQSPDHLVCRLLLEKKKKVREVSPFLNEGHLTSFPSRSVRGCRWFGYGV